MTPTTCPHCRRRLTRADQDAAQDENAAGPPLCADCTDSAVWAEPCPNCDRIPGRRACDP